MAMSSQQFCQPWALVPSLDSVGEDIEKRFASKLNRKESSSKIIAEREYLRASSQKFIRLLIPRSKVAESLENLFDFETPFSNFNDHIY